MAEQDPFGWARLPKALLDLLRAVAVETAELNPGNIEIQELIAAFDAEFEE